MPFPLFVFFCLYVKGLDQIQDVCGCKHFYSVLLHEMPVVTPYAIIFYCKSQCDKWFIRDVYFTHDLMGFVHLSCDKVIV